MTELKIEDVARILHDTLNIPGYTVTYDELRGLLSLAMGFFRYEDIINGAESGTAKELGRSAQALGEARKQLADVKEERNHYMKVAQSNSLKVEQLTKTLGVLRSDNEELLQRVARLEHRLQDRSASTDASQAVMSSQCRRILGALVNLQGGRGVAEMLKDELSCSSIAELDEVAAGLKEVEEIDD